MKIFIYGLNSTKLGTCFGYGLTWTHAKKIQNWKSSFWEMSPNVKKKVRPHLPVFKDNQSTFWSAVFTRF